MVLNVPFLIAFLGFLSFGLVVAWKVCLVYIEFVQEAMEEYRAEVDFEQKSLLDKFLIYSNLTLLGVLIVFFAFLLWPIVLIFLRT